MMACYFFVKVFFVYIPYRFFFTFDGLKGYYQSGYNQ